MDGGARVGSKFASAFRATTSVDRFPAEGLFHEKSGIVEDKTGDRLAFNGSLNETAAGWTRNWESLNVFTSWRDPGRVIEEDENFARLWTDQAKHVITMDVPTAVRDDLLRFLPATMCRLGSRRPRQTAAPERT